MEDYRWRFRPVLMSAPSDRDGLLLQQREAFSTALDGLRERDIVLIEIVGEDVATVIGPDCPAAAGDLRERYDIAADRFSVVLLGKDGGIKLLSDEPVSPERLFRLIDAMPMRQREMSEAQAR